MAAAVNNELHAQEVSEALNEVKFSGFHLRAIITAGMGFFTSAYDLTVIGTALALAQSEWHAKPWQLGLVASASLAATFVGAFFFGFVADKIGRKSVYGLEALLMVIGAVGSAFAGGWVGMVVWRCIMGFGIGGDYPLSAVLMSEYSNRENRGKMVGMVFSCQALGFLAGPIILMTLLGAGVNHDLCWRIALGVGALPALGVIFLRRTMPESPRWLARAQGKGAEAAKSLSWYSEGIANAAGSDRKIKEPLSKYARTILGTAGAWLVFDYAYYGNTIGMPVILNHFTKGAASPMIASTAWNVIIFGIFAVPGYVAAFMLSDRIGRKRLQMIGFTLMGLMFLLLGVIPGLQNSILPFAIVFGMSYFFAEFGPNVTTFVLAAELYPVNLRTTGHGISAGCGKIGAFIGVFLFPIIGPKIGFGGGMLLSAGMAVVGLILTAVCIDEPAGKSLEEAGRETSFEPSNSASSPSRVVNRQMEEPVGV